MVDQAEMTWNEFLVRFERFKEDIARNFTQALAIRAPVDTSNLRNQIDYRVEGDTIIIYMPGYSLFVEFGTLPHIIRPKNKKALKWKGTVVGPRGGKSKGDIFAKEVHHPGTKANPFISTTFRLDLPIIVKENARRHFL